MNKEEMISEIEIYLCHVVVKDFPLPKAIKLMYEEYKNQQEEIEKLKEKLNGERDFTKASLETLKECIHKEDLRRLFQSYMKRLNQELLTYDENDIENRTACQYAKAKLRFLLADIYKLLGY